MEEKIKILQLSPRYPFPPDDGGKIGIANITKEFAAQGADVTFFTFDTNILSDNDLSEIRPFAKLKIFKHSTENTKSRIFSSLFNKDSLYIKKHLSDEILSYLDRLVEEEKFDIIHADHTCMAPLAIYLKKKYATPVGLRLHNIEWTIWQRYADILNYYQPKRWYIQSQAKKLRKNEQDILKEVDIAFAITPEDKNRALELYSNLNVVVASAGVNLDEWKPDKSIERNPYELILATTYNWQHNIDALTWFIENVQNELYKLFPNIKLTLIGKNIPEKLNKYRNIGINPIGYVEDVKPYLNKAGIYISPLFVGGGIRIKILEALAMELPVLASPIAAEGINAAADNGLLICKSKIDFINYITKLINDADFRNELVSNSREFLNNSFTWKKNVKIIISNYKKIVNFH